LAPSEINFKPLNQESVLSGSQVIELYLKDRKMKEFAEIIKDSPLYPVVLDANNTVLSLPPLINSDHSKIKLTTKNIFVEITGIDQTKMNIALNTFISMFS
jgi:phenylalanyl-tRNA synthetase beta chain